MYIQVGPIINLFWSFEADILLDFKNWNQVGKSVDSSLSLPGENIECSQDFKVQQLTLWMTKKELENDSWIKCRNIVHYDENI